MDVARLSVHLANCARKHTRIAMCNFTGMCGLLKALHLIPGDSCEWGWCRQRRNHQQQPLGPTRSATNTSCRSILHRGVRAAAGAPGVVQDVNGRQVHPGAAGTATVVHGRQVPPGVFAAGPTGAVASGHLAARRVGARGRVPGGIRPNFASS